MTRNKKIGVYLFLSPLVAMIITLVSYALLNYLASTATSVPVEGTIGLGTGSSYLLTYAILKVILGIVGILSVIALFICWPIGIYFVAKKEPAQLELAAANNQLLYQNVTSEQITYIQGWSWGAFFSTIVWAVGNRLYLWALGSIVPFFGLYVWIKLASEGRQIAWEKSRWNGFEQFKKRQTIVMWVIIVLTLLAIALQVFLVAYYFSAQSTGSDYYRDIGQPIILDN